MKLKYSVSLPVAVAAIYVHSAVPAAAFNFSNNWVVEQQVPDNSFIGLTDVRTVSSSVTSILNVTVTLNITGGWAGDLFAYVVHDRGFAVLLNRTGRTAGNLLGNSAPGFQVVVLTDTAPDIHLAPPGATPLTGAFQPEGRIADPAAVTDTSPRSALLSSFSGLSAAGKWSLFVADVAAGDEATLQSWSLEITGVPEPSTTAVLTAALAACLFRRRRA